MFTCMMTINVSDMVVRDFLYALLRSFTMESATIWTRMEMWRYLILTTSKIVRPFVGSHIPWCLICQWFKAL